MSITPNLGLQDVPANSLQPSVPINAALRVFDALVPLAIQTTTSAPPVTTVLAAGAPDRQERDGLEDALGSLDDVEAVILAVHVADGHGLVRGESRRAPARPAGTVPQVVGARRTTGQT